MSRTYVFTSESVTEGHPDKIADQISDSVLDAVLAEDPTGRVACETLVTTGLVVVAGEISTSTYVDVPRLVRDRIAEIGYTHHELGLDAETCGVITSIQEQSPDIARGVDDSYETQQDPTDDDPLDQIGAGDQGMMFGYACRETPQLMPLPIMLAHAICRRLAEVRKAGVLPYLRPDGKAMVTVRYEEGDDGRSRPIEIDRLLVVSQHADGVDIEGRIKPDLIEHVLHPILPREFYDEARLGEDGLQQLDPGCGRLPGQHAQSGENRSPIAGTYGDCPHGRPWRRGYRAFHRR
jgi:S-adenosylmethionine synthetase